jgi:hypothetical protein
LVDPPLVVGMYGRAERDFPNCGFGFYITQESEGLSGIVVTRIG